MIATESNTQDLFGQAVIAFVEHIEGQVHRRWTVWTQEYDKRHIHEVVGGLLARQATLAGEFASNPSLWNDHTAPLFLRSMVENCITIAWILKEPEERASQFMAYGLGQDNLLLEHAKEDLREAGVDPDKDPEIETWERWLNSQRYTFLTEVNVGSWGPNLRDMAHEVKLAALYRNDYARWSGGTHSMWHHIARFNIQYCNNSLHGYHRIPLIAQLPPDPKLLWFVAGYVDLAFHSFDQKTGISEDELSAAEVLERELGRIPGSPESGAAESA